MAFRGPCILIGFCLFAGIGPGAPQNKASDTAVTSQPVIKVTTRLLQVSVIVHNKNGEPVSNLTREDFVLYDQGQKQEIRYFNKEADEALPSQLPALEDGAVSNRLVAIQVDGKSKVQPLPRSLTVILLDGLNTRFVDQKQAKAALIQFLKQVHSGDQVAIYTLAKDLRILHDFTSDVPSLLAALEGKLDGESMASMASSYLDAHTGKEELDQFLDRGSAQIAGYNQARRALTTAGALQAIAGRLAGLPGRKNLIWLAGDFPIGAGGKGRANGASGKADAQRDQPAVWGVLDNVGLSIYPVDAGGLIGMTEWMPSLKASTISVINPTGLYPMDVRAQDTINSSHARARLLAEHTGGHACLNNNDIAGCIRRAVEDARESYVLSYTPSHDEWNGEFREIQIKVNRPGLEARHQQGYYALPDPPVDSKTRQTLLAAAAMSPLPSTGLTLTARLLEKPTTSSSQATLSVVLNAHEITFGRNAQGQPDATVDLRVLVFGDQSTLLSQTGHMGHVVLQAERFEQILKDGVPLTMMVDTPAKARRVRVVVRDAVSGRVGSLEIPVL